MMMTLTKLEGGDAIDNLAFVQPVLRTLAEQGKLIAVVLAERLSRVTVC